MTDQTIRTELRKLGFSAAIILVIYAAIYITESRTHFLINMLS